MPSLFSRPAPEGATRTTPGPLGQLWTIGAFQPYSNFSLASHMRYCSDASFAATVREVDEEHQKKLFGGLYGSANAILDVFRQKPEEPLTIQQICRRTGKDPSNIESGLTKLMERGIVGQTTPLRMEFMVVPSEDGIFCLVNDAIRLLNQ